MWLGQDDTVQGLGCPGNTCVGADGNLYEWVEGVDGLGNPVGFWKRLKRGLRRLAPLASRLAPFIPGGAAVAALRAAAPYLRRAAPYLQRAGVAVPGVVPAPVTAPVAPDPGAPGVAPAEPVAPAPEANMAGWGLGADELNEAMGIGYFGEIAEGPDGRLYQWSHGVDGLGNPVGFWKRLKRFARQRLAPLAQRIAPFVPGGAAALTAATPFLKKAGFAGYDGLGALYQAPDGGVYQVQGVDADDELNGIDADEELRGLGDEELRGFADDELRGFADDDELRGIGAEDDLNGPEDELNGIGAGAELEGFADDEIHGFAQDDVQGIDGYLREQGVNGLEAYLPDAPRETPWFKAPNQPPPMWSPLW